MTEPSTTAPIVAITRAVPGVAEVPGADVRVLGAGHPKRDDLLQFVRGASVVVSMFSDRVDAELLDAAGDGLRGVCNFAVGHNNIDLTACEERGVTVTNTPDAVTEGTANIAWSLVLAVARRVVEGDRYVRTGAWERGGPLGMGDFLGMDLTGKTLLVVGAGRIGLAVAHRARAHGMRTLYVARSRKWAFELAPVAGEWVSLEEGLKRADVVSLHTPLTDQTRHLIGASELALLKETAILVNTARGPVVDEAALVEALRAKRLFGAGLDVLEDEPRGAAGLFELDSVVLTPHIGSAERRYREAMTAMVCENADAILNGRQPPNLVSR
ncbi:MAG: D-glycerate dehydrogenase [Phycisphaerae bacterium]|nr:D-glycerate dehydrogenase [Phycisphaerae bacterium]